MIGVGTTIFLVNPITFPSATSYLLDDYPSELAYSLRQLKTGVTNVVRVRRSSDNAESDFTADEITDGTLTTWTGANDGFVVKLYNQGSDGASYDQEQATAANQPRLVSSGVVDTKNGKPAMYFDGSNDVLQSATSLGAKNTYPFTCFGIGSNELTSNNGFAFSVREGTGSLEGWGMLFRRDGVTNAVFIDQGSSTVGFDYLATDNTNSQRLQTFNIDSSGNGELWLDSVSQATQTGVAECVPTNPTKLLIGGQTAGSTRLTGYVQEFIFYTSDEDANRTNIETNINDHYSIY